MAEKVTDKNSDLIPIIDYNSETFQHLSILSIRKETPNFFQTKFAKSANNIKDI